MQLWIPARAQKTCVKVPCSIESNCQLCDPKSFSCFLCKPGYAQNSFLGKNCIPISKNYSCNVDACSICSNADSNICTHCLEFFELNKAGKCERVKCIANCTICLESNTCISCQSGFYLTTDNRCQKINAIDVRNP